VRAPKISVAAVLRAYHAESPVSGKKFSPGTVCRRSVVLRPVQQFAARLQKGAATPSANLVQVAKATAIFGAVPPEGGPQTQDCTRNYFFLGVAVLLWRGDSSVFRARGFDPCRVHSCSVQGAHQERALRDMGTCVQVRKREGGSARKRTFPPLPKIMLCAIPQRRQHRTAPAGGAVGGACTPLPPS